MRKKQECKLLKIKIFFTFFGEHSKSLFLCFPAFLLQLFPEHLSCETGYGAVTKFLEEWAGAWRVTLPGKETWTCAGSSGCAISCVRPNASVKAPGCPERCWSSYRNMGGFAIEAFHLGERLSGHRLSRQSRCLQLHNHTNTDLRHPCSFLKNLGQDPVKGPALRHTEKAAFRPENFHVCTEHLRDK